jgi:ParB-like chromosome segregation protein Spo0J
VEYEIHPACAVIPLPPEEEINELANSIRTSGLLEPITLTKDQLLLDGRCRLKACTIAGVEVRTEIFQGDDPVMFVLDKNIRRRHLSKVQREIAVAQLVNLQPGSNQYQHKEKMVISNRKNHSIEELAQKHDLTKSGINRARVIVDKAAPHVREMVANGTVKPYIAERAVQHASLESQTNWTAEDVKREGRKLIDDQPGQRQKAFKSKLVKPQRDPYAGFRLNQIDPGPHGTRGNQRVFLWPPHVQNLMDDQVMISENMTGPVLTFRPVSEDWKFTPEVIGAALKRLLAYKPVLVGGKNGEEIDFEAKIRKELKLVTDGKIRKAIEWLTGLESAIADALQTPAESKGFDIVRFADQLEMGPRK